MILAPQKLKAYPCVELNPCNMAFVLTNILTWELTEGLICSLVHMELARLQTTRERATLGHEENSAWVVICMYLTMGKGKHVQFCKGNLVLQGPVLFV